MNDIRYMYYGILNIVTNSIIIMEFYFQIVHTIYYRISCHTLKLYNIVCVLSNIVNIIFR